MSRIATISLILLLLAATPALAAEEGFFAPESELAGWLWPAAFTFYGCKTVAVDFPVTFLIDTPRIVAASLGQRDAETTGALIRDLQDPYITVKNPIAAELRRRTGQDFGYDDEASLIGRQRAVAQWRKWARENRSP